MNKKKKSKTKVVIWIVVVLVVLVAIGWAVRHHRKGLNNYTEVQAKTGDITTYYSFPGTIEAINDQVVYADKAMQIKDIKVSEGQQVKKGDVLMTTTMGENITAPFDGEVSDVYAALDAQQMPGAQLCKVVDYSDLDLLAQVDEYGLPAISTGKAATITLNALGKDVSGKVTDIAKEGVSQNGITYFNAKVSLPVESDLRVGMTAQAKVLDQSVHGVTTLPMSAVQFDDQNASYVYVQGKNNLPEKVSVTLGINDGTTVQVKSGITNGETVLEPPADKSLSGIGGGRSRNASQTGTAQSGGAAGAAQSGGAGNE